MQGSIQARIGSTVHVADRQLSGQQSAQDASMQIADFGIIVVELVASSDISDHRPQRWSTDLQRLAIQGSRQLGDF